ARLKAYIVEVRKTTKGPQIVVSRTHPGLIKRLFELEVPEISDGVVELKAVAREPGHRTKIAVWSNDPNVDPVGACVGARGARVRMVVNELRGEKVDIVPFSEESPEFVMKALSPAKVKEVRIDEAAVEGDGAKPAEQAAPEAAEAAPETAEAAPETAETSPETAETSPETAETSPETAETSPETAEATTTEPVAEEEAAEPSAES